MTDTNREGGHVHVHTFHDLGGAQRVTDNPADCEWCSRPGQPVPLAVARKWQRIRPEPSQFRRDKPVPGHVFTFEMWPPDADERTLPGRTGRITAQSPHEARAAASGQLPAGGWTLGAGSHIRSACQPPHSGSDALAAPGSNQVWHATALAELAHGEVRRIYVAEWWPTGRVTLHSENPRRPNAAVSRRWVRRGADPGERVGWTVSNVEATAHYPSPEAFEAAFGASWGLVRAFERAGSMLPAGASAWDFADAEAASMRDEPEDDCAICAPGTCPGGSKCPGSLDTTPVLVTLSWPDTDPDRGSETYGPFTEDAEADAWITRCQDAAANGWTLLQDASYLIHRVELPFDPDALWEHGTDAHTTKENQS